MQHPSSRAWKQRNCIWVIFCAARYRAKVENIPFEINFGDIVVPKVCPIFGTPFEYGRPTAASIDRIDPTLGYVQGNVQVISKRANTMKSDASPEQLVKFAKWAMKSYG